MKACLESSLLPAYMEGVHPSEEGGPAGSADLLDVVLGQHHSFPRQSGQRARHVKHGLVVPANVSPAEVVRQHQHDVGSGSHQSSQTQQEEEEEGEEEE